MGGEDALNVNIKIGNRDEKTPSVFILALEKIREIIPFSSFSIDSPHLVLAQKNRSQSFYIYSYVPFLQKINLLRKKEPGHQQLKIQN